MGQLAIAANADSVHTNQMCVFKGKWTFFCAVTYSDFFIEISFHFVFDMLLKFALTH